MVRFFAVAFAASFILFGFQNPAHAVQHHLVKWVSEDYDHTELVRQQVLAAMRDNGVVEFVSGKVYGIKWMSINSTLQQNTRSRYMPAGLNGNGATLKALPGAHHSMLYLWNPQNSSNRDFFVRDLTIDCNENCDYGLRVWGGNDFLIENVTVRRSNVAGIFLQGSAGWKTYNATLRNVMARFNRGAGFQILGYGFGSVQNIRLENSYAHFNDAEGFLIEGASVDMLGCGAERNGLYGISAGSAKHQVDKLTIVGGYTEHNTEITDGDTAISLYPGAVSNLRIIGGRLLGRFSYDKSTLRDAIIHSYGHTRVGFRGNQPADTSFINNSIFSAPESIDWMSSQNRGYKEIPTYFLDGTSAVELRKKRNIHLVNYYPIPQNGDFTNRIQQTIEAAMATSGVVALEPKRVYRTRSIHIDRSYSARYSMPVGFLGNGSILTALPDSQNSDTLLNLRGLHVSRRPSNGDTWYDASNFFMRGVTIDAANQYKNAIHLYGSKFFNIQGVEVANALDNGMVIEGFAGDGVYYGVLDHVNARWNKNGFTFRGYETPAERPEPSGVYLANLGLYNCIAEDNFSTGFSVNNSSITLYGASGRNNDNQGLYTNHVRSVDLINSRLYGNPVAIEFAGKRSATDWTYGAHVLGGAISGPIDFLAAPRRGFYTLKQSMINTRWKTPLANASWLKTGPFGSIPE